MRTFLLSIVCMLALSAFVEAQAQEATAATLPRLGDHIDGWERAYFDLFRDVDDFRSADVLASGDGRLRCVIHSAQDADRTVTLDSLQRRILAAWLQHYERLSLADHATTRVLLEYVGTKDIPAIMNAFSRLNQRGIIDVDGGRFDTIVRPMIVLRSGDILRRTLLAVASSSLFVWDDDGIYDAATADRYVRRIPVDSIRTLETPYSIPVSQSIGLSTFAAWSGMMYAISRSSTGSPKDNIPVAGAAFFLPLPAAILGVPLGLAISAARWSKTSSIDDDSMAVKRAIPRLLDASMFGTRVPPEFRSFALADSAGLKVYGSGDEHPYAYIPAPKDDFAWMLGLETLLHIYDVHARPVSALIGLSLSRRFVLAESDAGWYFALRPRLTAGAMLGAEVTLQAGYTGTISFNAGLAYTHAFEELGASREGGMSYTQRWVSTYERASILQETFAVAGVTIATSYGSFEFQVRRLLGSAVSARGVETHYGQPDEVVTVIAPRTFWAFGMTFNVRL